MQGTRPNRGLILIIATVATVILSVFLDQITKLIFSNLYNANGRTDVINGFFYFTLTKNSGSGFSFLAGKAWAQTFFKIFTVISLVAFITLLVFSIKEGKFLLSISISLVIGGAIGNFIDRLLFNEVTDFIGFTFGSYNFPIFNLADSFLTVGVILIIVYYLFIDKEAVFKKKNGNKEDNSK